MAAPHSCLFLADKSNITTVSPSSTLNGVTFFSHVDPQTGRLHSKWSVQLTTAVPAPPSLNADVLAIYDAELENGDPHSDPVFVLHSTLTWYFHLPAPSPPLSTGAPRPEWTVTIDRTGLFSREESLAAAEQAGLILLFDGANGSLLPCVLRRSFWQVSFPYMKLPSPPIYTVTAGVRHPVRPRPARFLYRRHVPAVNAVLSFRLARIDDAVLLNTWMNIPRVADFWGEAGPVENTIDFIHTGLAKRHSFPVIGCWESLVLQDGRMVESGNEEPFGYFEIYWVKEDKLGQLCEAEDWERGLHVLVGEERFRGRVKAWLGSLVHYCFCDDPRTMRISLEPRLDNTKFIEHLRNEGFYQEKTVSFPHKQSALMRLTRDAWNGPSL